MTTHIKKKDLLLVTGTVLALFAFNAVGWLIVGPAVSSFSLSISVGLIVFVQIYIYRKVQEIFGWQQESQERRQRDLLRAYEWHYKQVEAMISMMQFLKLKRPLPCMRDWSISPDLGNIIISTILDAKPRLVVECGSGVSTLLTAYLLKEIGCGKIYSFEHDEKFAEITRKDLDAHELSDNAEVIHAPLERISLKGDTWMWYQNPFPDKIASIDLLIIDGPPGHIQKMARYPAVPMLYRQLSRSAIIILDDIKREDEREIVEAWLTEYGDLECEWRDTESGAAILRRALHRDKVDKKGS